MTATSAIKRQGQLRIEGDVLTVLEGKVSDKILRDIPQNEFLFGLGSGTFSEAVHLGETIVIGGCPYISWVANGKVCTESQPTVKSSFLMGIPAIEEEGLLERLSPHSPIPLQALYEEKSHIYPDGFIIIAKALFSELHSTYLKLAPVYGENINVHHSKYWAETPMAQMQTAFFFGVVIPWQGMKKFPENILKKAFYQNPADAGHNNFMNHSHAALLPADSLNRNVNRAAFLASLPHSSVTAVRHLLTQSLIKEVAFIVIPIECKY